jgi:TonB family protein
MTMGRNGIGAGNGGNGSIATAKGLGLRRRPSAPPPGETHGVAVQAPPPRGWRWLLAIAGGLLLGFLLLGALAWIQPSLQSDQRVELPAAVKLVLSSQKAEKKRAKSQDLKKEEKPQAREERARPRQAPPPKRIVQTRQAAPPPRPEMSALQNVSLFQGFGGAGGIALALADLQDEEAVQKAKDFAKYEERRRAIREGRAGGRSAAAGGRQGRQLVDINVSEPKEEHLKQPRYPQRAVKEQKEGFVRMRLLISTTGRVERHEIIAAEPEGYFEQSILEVLPSWQFTPAVDESGRPIESLLDFNYVFKLEDAV